MSAPVMREVRLYGPLGRAFGRVFRLAVVTPAEAVQALCSVLPGFRKAFVGPDGRQAYHVFVGRGTQRTCIGREEIEDPVGRDEPIRIVPVVQGAKRQGALQTILGVVLIVVGVYINVQSGGTGGNVFIQAGISMVIGGVVQMLSPQRKKPEDAGEGERSYGFDEGPVNSSTPGEPVPVAYGRVFAGSVVISGGLSVEPITTVSSGGGSYPSRPLPPGHVRNPLDASQY